MTTNRFRGFSDGELAALGECFNAPEWTAKIAASEEPHCTLFHEWAGETARRGNERLLQERRANRARTLAERAEQAEQFSLSRDLDELADDLDSATGEGRR